MEDDRVPTVPVVNPAGQGHNQAVIEQRKVVTVLFADLVGSTAMAAQTDPEVVRVMMSRYFKRVSEIAAAYGGTVEKFAGDAAMVVFGVPTVHDDDSERAVRAALEIRDGATERPVRVGVNTGEAVTALSEDRQFMVSGDAVNVAARLQQGGDAGEVVVGHLTYQLTRSVIEYEPHQPIAAKGKPEPLPAYRAVRARHEVPVQARGVPGLRASLVGRMRELRLLLDTFARAAEDRNPHLFTLVGAAGVGKSRLVQEAISELAGSGARVLRGRCLPYGRGIMYWPLIEMVRQDTGIGLADERDVSLMKLDGWLGELLSDDPQRVALRARVAVMLGLQTAESAMPDMPAERVEQEIAWAVRRYLQAIAQAGPVIVVIDDLQWAEPPVLAVIEQLAERMTSIPLAIVCIARPEFAESHPGWSSGKPNATTLTLDPLNPAETATLISRLLEIEALPEALREQIVDRSAGTPLFCEELIHMLIDEGQLIREAGRWKSTGMVEQVEVPQTITAVLAARLDALPEVEKSVLQAASVIGERFELRQVQELTGESDLEPVLESLRRKGLVQFGEKLGDEMHYRHLLIRDAAYASLPKSRRAALHDRFGSALEREAGDPQQFMEILAHHAERAFTLSRELGIEGETVAARAGRAVQWSLALADRARTRRDVRNLDAALETASSAAAVLSDHGGLELRAKIRLLEAQSMVIRGDYAGATLAAAEAAALGEEGNLLQLVATARLTEAWIWNWAGELTTGFADRVEGAIEATRQVGDTSGEIEARHLGTNILFGTGRLDEFIEQNERLLAQARNMGDEPHAAAILERLAHVELLSGNLEVADRYTAEAQSLASRLGLRNVSLDLARARAHKLLFSGEFDTAIDAYRQVIRDADDSGVGQMQIAGLRFLAYALRWQRRYSEMAEVLDRAIELSETSGERWNRAEVIATRARAALELGEIDAADNFIQRALECVRSDDVTGISEVYDHLGMIRAAQGRDAEAEAALRRGVDSVINTHYVWVLGNAIVDLARFLAERGRLDEASSLIEPFAHGLKTRRRHMSDQEIDEVRQVITAASR